MNDSARKDWSKTLTSAASAIYGAISYTDKKDLSLVDVMGLTGHAFRMNIEPKKVDISGPTSFPGGYILRRNLSNLGFTSNLADPYPPVPPKKLEKVLALIQESIDRGVPAITFDLFSPEFGLLYGYDDEQQLFYAKDSAKDGTVSYAEYSDATFVLFAVTISESLPHSQTESIRMALDMIVDHARGREWKHIFEGKIIQGLAAYDAWIQAISDYRVDELGNAYSIAILSDAREFATQFLNELPDKFTGDTAYERTLRRESAKAAKQYFVVAEALGKLRELFPFPEGGVPKEPSQAKKAVALLEQAKEAETKGVEALENMLEALKAYPCDRWIN